MGKCKLTDRHHKRELIGQPPAGDHKAHTNRRTQRHSKHKTEKNVKDPQKKYRPRTASKHTTEGTKPASRRQPHPQPRCQLRHIEPGQHERPPTHHLPEHTNKDTTKRQSKDKGSTANKTEHRRAQQQPKQQAPTISSTDKPPSRNPHRARSLTHQRATKEESKAANHNWVDHQACSLLQHINTTANLLTM